MSGCWTSSLVPVSVQVSYRGAGLTVSVGAMGVEDEGIMDDFAICKRQIQHHRRGLSWRGGVGVGVEILSGCNSVHFTTLFIQVRSCTLCT